jgi:RasGEF domain/RasGEF N-terminal motif
MKRMTQRLSFRNRLSHTSSSLNSLVERLTAQDSTPDPPFVTTVYLTFRLFANPQDFVSALEYRFRYTSDSHRSAAVRLRVYNAFKGWLENHWRHDCDDVALPSIIAFAREDLTPVLPTAAKRLLELADIVGSTHAPAVPRVVSAIGKTNTSTAAYVNPEAPLPPSILSKGQLTALRIWKMGGAPVGILDFDALELARQITLKTSQLFCSILPEELLATEWTKQSSSLAVNVRAMSTLSTDLSNLVADSILIIEDTKKRALTIKQWIKIATKCLDLHNFDTVFAIVCSLDSTNIKRMRKTWDIIPQKSKNLLDELKRVCDFSKNYSALRQSLSSQVPPCIPFLGMYLTDLTFIDHGNQATRELSRDNGSIPVINLDKHMRTARIISDLQRFQIPYRFAEVSELQTWMQDQLIRVRSEGEKNYQNHYRRSLILEPRDTAKISPNPGSMKDRFDFLAWTHISKDKPVTINS